LPDGALGAGQAADEEAVELDLFAGPGGLDVALWGRDRRLAFVGVAVARDQREALGAGVQAHADQDAPDAVL
jgi:hypothetical protein